MNDLSFSTELQSAQKRLGITSWQLSRYLGVSYGALRHWVNGSRQPDTVARRLVQVLGTIETMAPDIHKHLMPPDHPPAKPRGRRIPRVPG